LAEEGFADWSIVRRCGQMLAEKEMIARIGLGRGVESASHSATSPSIQGAIRRAHFSARFARLFPQRSKCWPMEVLIRRHKEFFEARDAAP
jgi:hypothetical protein